MSRLDPHDSRSCLKVNIGTSQKSSNEEQKLLYVLVPSRGPFRKSVRYGHSWNLDFRRYSRGSTRARSTRSVSNKRIIVDRSPSFWRWCQTCFASAGVQRRGRAFSHGPGAKTTSQYLDQTTRVPSDFDPALATNRSAIATSDGYQTIASLK